MFTQKSKLSVVTRLFLGIVLSILACIGLTTIINQAGRNSSQLPIRSLRVNIDKSQRKELFNQLQKFATKHAFKFTISDYGTDDEIYLVEILGDNIKILATITRPDPNLVSVGFYGKSPEALPPDEQTVDDLLDDLKTFISEIPNVTITEEK